MSFKEEPRARWWSGGVAGGIVQFFVAPFDLLEARMQVEREKKSLKKSLHNVMELEGFFGFYDGLSAALMRSMTYTAVRFAVYDQLKHSFEDPNFPTRVLIACCAGTAGGLVGIPMDVINTRMQVDKIKKKKDRWGYRHVFEGLWRCTKEEGFKALYSGGLVGTIRAVIMTIGQNAVYDQFKDFYMKRLNYQHSDPWLHLLSSFSSSLVLTTILHPFELIKNLLMTAPVGDNKIQIAYQYMFRHGMFGPYRGFLPSILRQIPNTVLTFVIYEQLRLEFGYYLKEEKKPN